MSPDEYKRMQELAGIEKFLQESRYEDFQNLDELYESLILNESLKIDLNNSHSYSEEEMPDYTSCFMFKDRCQNTMAIVYIENIKEIKSGFYLEEEDRLIFDYKNLAYSTKINPCSDNKVLSTIAKIINNEIIPKYLFRPGPQKLLFAPISPGRQRLTNILLNKLVELNPGTKINNNNIIKL